MRNAPIVENAVAEYFGPRDFHWLVPGLLGGAPRPGVFKDDWRDYEALRRVNTKLLVTLTDEWEPDADEIAKYGMKSFFVPIIDLTPPSIDQAISTCVVVEEYVARREAVVFHCLAGKGRTGTMLATMLIWSGSTAKDAILYTRAQNPRWIESESQLDFLAAFAKHVAKPTTPVLADLT